MANGEKSTQWGDITNTNWGLIEAAIAGRASITHDDTASYTLSTANGSADEARCMIKNIAGTLTAARNAVVPTVSQAHIVKNATSGGYAVTLKTSGGTGIAIPNGKTTILFCDGTNVVNAIDYLNTLTAGTFGVRSSGTGAYDLQIANTENLTANRALTIKLNDAARTVDLGGNLTTAGALSTSGAYSCAITLTGNTTVTLPESGTLGITLGTEQASTSGTAIDFTSIPAWVRRITVMFNAVSTSAASGNAFAIQIGDSGGIEATGYQSAWADVLNIASGGSGTTYFGLTTGNNSSSQGMSGTAILTLQDSSDNTWAITGSMQCSSNLNIFGGIKSLSGTLDRVRIIQQLGGTFDAGAINITYER